MIIEDVISTINRGKEGKNIGLNLGFTKLIDYLPNLQRGNIYVIGGETGSAKSTFTLNNFVYTPYEDYLTNYKDKIKYKTFIWSLEMDKQVVITRAVARRLYNQYHLLVDVNHILSRGKYRIKQEIYEKVLECRNYFEELEDHIIIMSSDDKNSNPTGIRNTIQKYMLNIGKEVYKTIEITNKDNNQETIQVFDKYIPNNPETYVTVIIDHISLVKSERGFGKKEKIDKTIEYLIDFRDRYGIIPIVVQQLNRNIASTDRFKLGTVEPQLSDFKETSDSTDAANYVLALFNPMRYEINPYRDYNILKLKDNFRSVKLLKNRDGAANIVAGMFFLGQCGYFKELPLGKELTDANYKYIEEEVKKKIF
jgi:replicative DNA helicase